ncbi:MAG: hypothetical protein JXO44_13590 [Clostridia bacterium]|nr:hypothetical protein [Clostridia bacterium]
MMRRILEMARKEQVLSPQGISEYLSCNLNDVKEAIKSLERLGLIEAVSIHLPRCDGCCNGCAKKHRCPKA